VRLEVLDESRRQRRAVVGALRLLVLVDAERVVAADPLAPAVELDAVDALASRRLRIAHEPDVHVEPLRGQRARQALDARRETARPRVGGPSNDST